MNKSDLIEKVCSINITLEELKEFFNSNIEFTGDFFDKYYSLDLITNVINKFSNNEITNVYFKHWIKAYLEIVNCIDIENVNDEKIIEMFVKYEIIGILLTISNIDEISEFKLKEFIKGLNNLDSILESINNWNGYFTPTKEQDFGEDQYILLVNEKEKKYVVFFAYVLDNKSTYKKINRIDNDSFDNKINELEKNEYQNLQYLNY